MRMEFLKVDRDSKKLTRFYAAPMTLHSHFYYTFVEIYMYDSFIYELNTERVYVYTYMYV